ncbi:MAG: MFS transporter [Acidobacteria bacterium]|nr:MFS transporter [Acidobacteriota bacterium]
MCRTPVLPLFASALGAGPRQVGVVVAASTLTGIAIKLPAGALSDVLGRRTLLVGGAIAFALFPFGYLAVTALASLVLLRFLHGAATATFGPVASAAISDIAPPERRGAWLGWYSSIQSAGQALGPVLAGALIAGDDFRLAFVVSGVIGLGALITIAGRPAALRRAQGVPRLSRDAVRRIASAGRTEQFRIGIQQVIADRRIVITSVAQSGQFVVNGALNAFLPLYAKDRLGLTPAEIGLLFGIQTAVTLLARPVLGAASDRAGRRPMIAAGLIGCGVAAWGFSYASSVSAVLLTAAAYGASLGLATSATSAYVTDLARRAQYGAAHGVFGTIYDIGDAAGPIVAGFLVAGGGYAIMFRLVGTAAILLAVVFVTSIRPRSG